jgi:hypothetical protein
MNGARQASAWRRQGHGVGGEQQGGGIARARLGYEAQGIPHGMRVKIGGAHRQEPQRGPGEVLGERPHRGACITPHDRIDDTGVILGSDGGGPRIAVDVEPAMALGAKLEIRNHVGHR